MSSTDSLQNGRYVVLKELGEDGNGTAVVCTNTRPVKVARGNARHA